MKGALSEALRALLACPRCHGPLQDAEHGGLLELRCPACRLGYPVRDGVPQMLPEEARPLDERLDPSAKTP